MVPVLIIYAMSKSSVLAGISSNAYIVSTKKGITKRDLVKVAEEYLANTPVSKGSLWTIEMAPEETEEIVPQSEVKQEVIENSEELYSAKPYPVSLEKQSGIINRVSFSRFTSSQYINLDEAGQVRNCTKLSNDILKAESKKSPLFKVEAYVSEPQVLIMHSHTTESFEPYTRDFYDDSFNSRSTDPSKNIVAVGDKITKELEKSGISVIHDKTIHDYPTYTGAYQRSEQTVKKILKQYPSIKMVFDVHRDAIQKEDKTRVAPTCVIGDKQAAQIMIISGCDDGTMNMPNYLYNFRLACGLQQQIESDNNGITRPVLFDYRKYNQHLTTGSLLIEVGSSANSFDEVLYTGELVGKSLAKYILNNN